MSNSSKQNTDYKEKVSETLKDKSTLVSLGLFGIFLLIAGFLIFNNNQDSAITEESEQINQDKETEDTNTQGTYTVQEGDNLWRIAQQETGSGENWTKIAEANNIQDPDGLNEGQEIIIPEIDETMENESQGDIASAETDTMETEGKEPEEMDETVNENADNSMDAQEESTYIVQKGDNLWKIAKENYGDGTMWTEICELNNIMYPDLIDVGQVLTLPAKS